MLYNDQNFRLSISPGGTIMSADPRKRQKKLAKKAAKRKEKKHELVKQKTQSLVHRLEGAASAPVYVCWQQADLFDIGMGHVMFSRRLADGTVAFGLFLVDAWCLGVKDAVSGLTGRFEFDSRFATYKLPYKIKDLKPEDARKLVEGAVAYARELGFAPHPDYETAREIFGSVDPNLSQEVYEFGQDGMPHFVAGPYDTPQRCRRVINILERTCGRGNYHYTVPVPTDDVPEEIRNQKDWERGTPLLEGPYEEQEDTGEEN
jgi:hypothetical protein